LAETKSTFAIIPELNDEASD